MINIDKIDSKIMQELKTYGGSAHEQKVLGWLLKVFQRLVSGKQKEFNRNLSFGDYFIDRFEKANALGFGVGTSVYDNVLILGNVKVGRNCWIGPNVVLDGSGYLQIGDYVSISAGVQIYSHDSVRWAISGGMEDYEYNKTIIGNNVYIGPNVIIQKGVEIGDKVIIGANSFVNKDIPSDSKAYGSPIKVINI